MNVLVMGGRRLVGNSLVRNLVREGHEVTIANRSGKTPCRETNAIIFDRKDGESIKKQIGSRHFDVIYDMICYSAADAQALIGNLDADLYIMMSSSVVYDWGVNLCEDAFLAESYETVEGSIEELGIKYGYKQAYMIGKRSAESVIANHLKIPNLTVRMPLVFGRNDHTERFKKLVGNIYQEKPIYCDNLSSVFSVLYADNAGEYLVQLANIGYRGSINICDGSTISMKEIIDTIGYVCGRTIHYKADGETSGYNSYFSCVLETLRMARIGIHIHSSKEWFKNFVNETVQEWRDINGGNYCR